MKNYFFILPVLGILSSCSRPETPPTTPVQPPTVEVESTTTTKAVD